jgi:hypothetical protein
VDRIGKAVKKIALFLNISDFVTSQETHLLASAACYLNLFTSVQVGYVRTSQKTHLRICMACYEYRSTVLYVNDVRT